MSLLVDKFRRDRTHCMTLIQHAPDPNKVEGLSVFEEACHNATSVEAIEYMRNTSEALVLTDERGNVIDVNKPWEYLCGYTFADIKGKTCSILQGPRTEKSVIRSLSDTTRGGNAVRRTVTNYKKCGMEFANNVTILPLDVEPVNKGKPAFVARLYDAVTNAQRAETT